MNHLQQVHPGADHVFAGAWWWCLAEMRSLVAGSASPLASRMECAYRSLRVLARPPVLHIRVPRRVSVWCFEPLLRAPPAPVSGDP